MRRVEEVRILLFFEIFYEMRKDLLVQELIKLIKIYIQRLNGYLGCGACTEQVSGQEDDFTDFMM